MRRLPLDPSYAVFRIDVWTPPRRLRIGVVLIKSAAPSFFEKHEPCSVSDAFVSSSARWSASFRTAISPWTGSANARIGDKIAMEFDLSTHDLRHLRVKTCHSFFIVRFISSAPSAPSEREHQHILDGTRASLVHTPFAATRRRELQSLARSRIDIHTDREQAAPPEVRVARSARFVPRPSTIP
jgi:hypothetical protein